jgi:UDP-N-acetylmuramoyl-L-alanyl-D-glutamate--2,6-diaminopimelate ligase
MRRLAVTGTNGKTSTVEFTRQLLAGAGHRAASYGTLGLVTEQGREPEPSTTIGPHALSTFLSRLELRGTDVVTLEAYSSSLAGDLFDHVTVEVAAFTNFARDHLDLHGDVESYFAAKRSLFAEVLADDGTAVLNLDDDRSADLAACCRDRRVDVCTFGWSEDADVRIHETTSSADGITAALDVGGRGFRVDFDLVGDVMVSNACCALATALATGLPVDAALDGLESLEPPPGRLDRVGSQDGVELFVDYAHTPAALRAVLETLQTRATGDLLVVFGCGGDRDQGKRGQMGTVAGTHADTVVVTDDNPRTEDPEAIRADVLAGCPDARECAPREQAITTAVASATTGDVVVVAGKGHERTQTIGRQTREFSDHDVLDRLVSP